MDVGAGLGTELPEFSRLVGPLGRVIAIEGHPWCSDRLRETVRLNQLTNVTSVEVAIADRVGTRSLRDNGNDLESSLVDDGARSLSVKTATLDQILGELRVSRVDLLKMNIEGAEAMAASAANPYGSGTPRGCRRLRVRGKRGARPSPEPSTPARGRPPRS